MRVTSLLLCIGLWACTGSPTEPASRDDAGGTYGEPGANDAATNAATNASDRDAQASDGRVTPGNATPTDAGSAKPDAGSAKPDAAAPDVGALTLALFNVVRKEPLSGFSPLPAVLQRVELPPRVTVAASGPSDVKAVRFFVDGMESRLDSQAPFLLSETSSGEPSAWTLAAGVHQIEARAYRDAAATGAPMASARWELDYQRRGLPKAFTPLSEAANKDWVSSSLDTSMVSKTFQGSTGTLPYRLFTPPDYDAAVHYPLLVYLHGRGERGTDNRSATYRSTQLFMGARSLVSPNFRNDYPAIVLVPQCSNQPDSQEWAHWTGSLGQDGSYKMHPAPSSSTQLLSELVSGLRGELSIDSRRIYVTGESMGGIGTWEVTARWPAVWAAGVPMAGYSDRNQAAVIKHIPFWIFHGSVDEINTVLGSRAMFAALKAVNADVRYTEYDGLNHVPTFQRAWTQEPELLPWIFAQYRQP